MTQPLFVEPDVKFEKVGAEVTLPDDPTQWPTEVLQELYKQVPYVSDFMPDVIMDRVDGEKRYGFGHIEVSNKTEIQDSPESQTSQAAGIRHVRIPVIINEGKLQPFDVLVTDTSKMLPLTERRLRQSLFRPQLFDVTSRTPGDQSMISQLYPPYRQNYGFGGGGATMSAGMGKEGNLNMRALVQGSVPVKEKKDNTPGDTVPMLDPEKTARLLSSILPTIDTEDYIRFSHTVSEPSIHAAMVKNAASMHPSIEVLRMYEPNNGLAQRAEKLAQALIPTALQVYRAAEGGYRIKTASHRSWAPMERAVDRGEVVRAFGAKLAMDVDTTGAVTGGDGGPEGAVTQDLPEVDEAKLISEYGIYKVQDSNGRQLVGFVFPNLIDLDGTSLPIALFTNGSVKAVQGEIAGVRVSEGAALIEGHPRGSGAFYKVLQNGKAVATVPMNIQSNLQSEEGGVTLAATSPMHGDMQVQISIQPNIKVPTLSGEQFIVPEDWSWLPLDAAEDVELAESPDVFQKEAGIHPDKFVEIRADGPSFFSFSGTPVEKLSYDNRSFLCLDDAMFLLAGLGVSPSYSVQKLGEAVSLYEPVRVKTARALETPESLREGIVEKLASVRIPNLRIDLVKEAAFIPDTTAVDTVLSLGFINPENVLTFVGYLPYLDEAQEKLCELLIASRMGLRDIDTGVLERAIRGVEATLEGLRTLAFQEN